MCLPSVGRDHLLLTQKMPGEVERITYYNSSLMLSVTSTKYTNTLFTAQKRHRKQKISYCIWLGKNRCLNHQKQGKTLILVRKVIGKSSHLKQWTGTTLCDDRTFRLLRNSMFLSRVYSQAMEVQEFWSLCAPGKEIDRTDVNSSYLNMILCS